jgi:hypothetical protein
VAIVVAQCSRGELDQPEVGKRCQRRDQGRREQGARDVRAPDRRAEKNARHDLAEHGRLADPPGQHAEQSRKHDDQREVE